MNPDELVNHVIRLSGYIQQASRKPDASGPDTSVDFMTGESKNLFEDKGTLKQLSLF